MDRKNFKPVENHKTAAWAEIKHMKNVSKVTVPGEQEILNAKEYVDDNQK